MLMETKELYFHFVKTIFNEAFNGTKQAHDFKKRRGKWNSTFSCWKEEDHNWVMGLEG